MILVRIAALALLLGVAVAGLVWFGWGVIQALGAGRTKSIAEPPVGNKEAKREAPAKPAKPA